jgi:hypothetical protein
VRPPAQFRVRSRCFLIRLLRALATAQLAQALARVRKIAKKWCTAYCNTPSIRSRSGLKKQEYQGVSTNSPDWHKWKDEMITYANVVAVLEDLKSRPVLVR